MNLKNQKGLTLIELLATITVLSIIGLIIWGVFIQGTQYFQNAMTKNQMQQEANIILERIKNIHQTSDSYTIAPLDNRIIVEYKEKGVPNEKRVEFKHNNLDFSVEVFESDEEGKKLLLNNKIIIPGDKNPEVKLMINDSNDIDNNLEVSSFLFKLGGNLDES